MLNQQQIAETVAMHLYNRFSDDHSKAFQDLPIAVRQQWISEAWDVLTMTGLPDAGHETVVPAIITRVQSAEWLERVGVPSGPYDMINLQVSIRDVFGPGVRDQKSQKLMQLLRSVGVSPEAYDKEPDVLEGKQARVRLSIDTRSRGAGTAIPRLYVASYEI